MGMSLNLQVSGHTQKYQNSEPKSFEFILKSSVNVWNMQWQSTQYFFFLFSMFKSELKWSKKQTDQSTDK